MDTLEFVFAQVTQSQPYARRIVIKFVEYSREGSISGLCGSVSQGREKEKEVMGSKSGK